MAKTQSHLALLAALTCLLGLTPGCVFQRGQSISPLEVAPLRDGSGHPGRLVTLSPGSALDLAPDAPWQSRNDLHRTVASPYPPPVHVAETSVEYTVDQQDIINGRVRDHYRQRTHRQTIRGSGYPPY